MHVRKNYCKLFAFCLQSFWPIIACPRLFANTLDDLQKALYFLQVMQNVCNKCKKFQCTSNYWTCDILQKVQKLLAHAKTLQHICFHAKTLHRAIITHFLQMFLDNCCITVGLFAVANCRQNFCNAFHLRPCKNFAWGKNHANILHSYCKHFACGKNHANVLHTYCKHFACGKNHANILHGCKNLWALFAVANCRQNFCNAFHLHEAKTMQTFCIVIANTLHEVKTMQTFCTVVKTFGHFLNQLLAIQNFANKMFLQLFANPLQTNGFCNRLQTFCKQKVFAITFNKSFCKRFAKPTTV